MATHWFNKKYHCWIGRDEDAASRWWDSLRKVEDIIVKENKLKVGDKVELLGDYCGFKKGQIVQLYELCGDGAHLFKGDNTKCENCEGEDWAYLGPYTYKEVTPAIAPPKCTIRTESKMVDEYKPHPHADLMLKYAMIAQYDDKPWENFEVLLDGEWVDCEHEGLYAGIEYRLKPQEPKIQVGQVWVSREGVEVNINRLANKLVFTEINIGGLTIPWSFKQNQFFSNFKLKENK